MNTVAAGDLGADLLLIDRIAARDAGAIGTLYDRHGRLLYSLILRILRDRTEAEEVLQEVFLIAWTRSDTYDRELGSPIAWLVRIARNRAIDRVRASQVTTRPVEGGPVPGPIESPESAALMERRRMVVQALAALSSLDRQLIETAYFTGLSQAELAARFELPPGTVKTRIRAGLKTLHEALQHRHLSADAIGATPIE